jgi:hypothetical protein
VWQLFRTGYSEEIELYLRRAMVANGEYPPTILAQIWLVQLATYGREEGLEIARLRTLFPQMQTALQLDDARWLAIERMLDWWLEHWQMLHGGQLGDLYRVQQIVHGATQLEEAGHIRSSVEWVEWWLKVWRTFLQAEQCGAGHEMAAFLDKTGLEIADLAKASIVYAPHKVTTGQLMVFWQQAQLSGLIRPSDKHRIVSLSLTYFGQSLLGRQWRRAGRGLWQAVRFSFQPQGLSAWGEFIRSGLQYWRNVAS